MNTISLWSIILWISIVIVQTIVLCEEDVLSVIVILDFGNNTNIERGGGNIKWKK